MLGLSLGSWAGGKWIPYLKKKVNLSAIIFYGLAEIVIGFGAFVVPHLFAFGETLSTVGTQFRFRSGILALGVRL